MSERTSELTVACESGDADAVRELLHAGADPHALDEFGMRALDHAVRGDSMLSTARVLVDHVRARGEDVCRFVNHTGRDGASALLAAVAFRRDDATRFLLENGARADIVDDGGVSPLCPAVAGRDHATLELLLRQLRSLPAHERESAMRQRTRRNATTAMHLAAMGDDERTVCAMLRAGWPLDVEDARGRTPLHTLRERMGFDAAEALVRASGRDAHVSRRQ